MTAPVTQRAARHPISFPLALGITLMMALVYTVIDTIQLSEPLQSIASFIPAVTSLGLLTAAGLSQAELNLRVRHLSRAGLQVLAGVTLLLLPILASSTLWIGWRWLPALVYAPASGIAQELYFRSALLPALERQLAARKTWALLLHSVIFVGFHFRTFRLIGSAGPALVVAVVLFLAGCGWGWQVQRDRTVFWAQLQHSLFLVLMSMFAWG